MLLKKQKNRKQYLVEREQVRIFSYKFNTWQFDSLLEILEYSYKISHFFYTYYKCFQKRSAQKLLGLQTQTNRKSYILWRLLSAISISDTLKIYEKLNVNLKLEHVKGESFYAGIPQITQEEIDFADKITAFYENAQPVMRYGVRNKIEEKYGVSVGEYSEEGYDNIGEIESIRIPNICGDMSFCPAIIMEDGKYHIWNR